MKIKDQDIMELLNWFENTLGRISKVDRKEKMRMRRKVRDEPYLLLTWGKPSPDAIMKHKLAYSTSL